MIWHVVRLDFTGVDTSTRDDLESQLLSLEGLDEVAWLRLEHDLADPDVTGLLTGFASEDDLEAYRTHPDHVPVVAALEAAAVGLTRLDLETDDTVDDLP